VTLRREELKDGIVRLGRDADARYPLDRARRTESHESGAPLDDELRLDGRQIGVSRQLEHDPDAARNMGKERRSARRMIARD
jgi:hypothetical protein